MYSKVFAFVCFQLAVFNAASTQCINRCPTETIIPANPCPNQYFVNPTPCNIPTPIIVNSNPCNPCNNPNPIIVNSNPCNPCKNPNPIIVNSNPCPNQLFLTQNPAVIETVYQTPIPSSATTIIQDNSVANNLANALQLLVVSNLLSNTLPVPGQIEFLPTYTQALEIVPTCAQQTIEVLPACPTPCPTVEIASAAPCGCGCGYGGYNYVF